MEDKEYKIGLYDHCHNLEVFSEVPKKSACLDVGCWTGNLGQYLIKNKDCTVDGIELNADALAAAKKRGYRNCYLADLNKFHHEDIVNVYDFIICADVLEHLVDPGLLIVELGKLLGKNGKIIISVPNVCFVLQRFMMILGRFDYDPRGGIMDAGHLRFFTKKSIEKLCLVRNFKIVESRGYSQVKNKYFFLRPLARLWPSLFAIQFLLIIKKNER